MRNEWMEIFSQEGYRFCKVKPEETGVFYKYYEEGFHLVMFIDGTNGYLPTMGQLQVMQERVQELFYHPVGRLQDFPEGFPVYHVELLTILLTNQSENAKQLCSEEKNMWIYDQDRKQLIIYENQPGDFWGLKNRIEHMDVQQNSRASAPVSGKHSIMQLPFVTGLIALANILVYIILSFGGATEDAFYMASRGAMYPEFLTINHQWWRLLTAIFLHFGVAHLMNNMVIFCCVGSRLEKYIGHWKMAVVYFAAGIGGGLLSYIMMLLSGNYAVSGGASGAVFGVIGGLLWVVTPQARRHRLQGLRRGGAAEGRSVSRPRRNQYGGVFPALARRSLRHQAILGVAGPSRPQGLHLHRHASALLHVRVGHRVERLPRTVLSVRLREHEQGLSYPPRSEDDPGTVPLHQPGGGFQLLHKPPHHGPVRYAGSGGPFRAHQEPVCGTLRRISGWRKEDGAFIAACETHP